MRYLVLLICTSAAVACEEAVVVDSTPAEEEAIPPRDRQPRLSGFIPDLTMATGQTVVLQNPQRIFSDDSPLTHFARSSDPAVAAAAFADSTMTIVAISPGVTLVTLMASQPPGTFARALGDSLGHTVRSGFHVTVRPRENEE